MLLSVFQSSLLKVALSKVYDPDIEMKGKSGADPVNRLFTQLTIEKRS